MKDPNMFDEYHKFCEKVGLLDEEDLIKLGWPVDNGNMICFSKHTELWELIEVLNAEPNGDKYHIATKLSCSDDLESEAIEKYCKKIGVNPEDFEEEIRAYGEVILNQVAYVNRMEYFLCRGDANEDIYLEEVEVIDDRELVGA